MGKSKRRNRVAAYQLTSNTIAFLAFYIGDSR